MNEQPDQNNELRRRFNRFMDNEWPHAQQVIGEIKGRVSLLVWSMGAILALMGAILARLLMV